MPTSQRVSLPQEATVTRGHHEGSIFRRRRDGKWTAAVSMPNGRRVERSCRWYDNTRAAAKELLTDLLEERDAELDLPSRKLTTAAWLRSWLADMESAGRLRPRTLAFYGWVIESRIVPGIGSVPLARLGPTAIQRWLDSIEDSPRTRAHCFATLRAALNAAVRRRKLARSPLLGVELGPVPEHRATVLSVAEARQLIEGTAGDWYHALWVLLLASGLRISEALGLTWDDLDADAGTLAVSAQLAHRDGAWFRVPTKADRSLDRIALPSFALAALAEHRARMAAARQPSWSHFGHIFVTPAGAPPHKVGPDLTAACDRLGIPRVTPHELRHASLTILADAGVAEDVRQRRAGHSTATMARRYTSQAEAADRSAADALDRVMGGK